MLWVLSLPVFLSYSGRVVCITELHNSEENASAEALASRGINSTASSKPGGHSLSTENLSAAHANQQKAEQLSSRSQTYSRLNKVQLWPACQHFLVNVRTLGKSTCHVVPAKPRAKLPRLRCSIYVIPASLQGKSKEKSSPEMMERRQVDLAQTWDLLPHFGARGDGEAEAITSLNVPKGWFSFPATSCVLAVAASLVITFLPFDE